MLGKNTRDLTNIAQIWTCVCLCVWACLYVFELLFSCYTALTETPQPTECTVLDHEGVFGVRCIAQ